MSKSTWEKDEYRENVDVNANTIKSGDRTSMKSGSDRRILLGDSDGNQIYFASLPAEKTISEIQSDSGEPDTPHNNFRKPLNDNQNKNASEDDDTIKFNYVEFSYTPKRKSFDRFETINTYPDAVMKNREHFKPPAMPKTNRSSSVSELKDLFDTQVVAEDTLGPVKDPRYSMNKSSRSGHERQTKQKYQSVMEKNRGMCVQSTFENKSGIKIEDTQMRKGKEYVGSDIKSSSFVKLQDVVKNELSEDGKPGLKWSSSEKHSAAENHKHLTLADNNKPRRIAVAGSNAVNHQERPSCVSNQGFRTCQLDPRRKMSDSVVFTVPRREQDQRPEARGVVSKNEQSKNKGRSWSNSGLREDIDIHSRRSKMPPRRASSVEFQGLEENVEVYGTKQIDINAILGFTSPKIEEEDNDLVFDGSHDQDGIKEKALDATESALSNDGTKDVVEIDENQNVPTKTIERAIDISCGNTVTPCGKYGQKSEMYSY